MRDRRSRPPGREARAHRQPGADRGAAAILAVAVLGLLLFVTGALGVVGALVSAHREAQSAADLSALGAAATLQRRGDPCAAATRLAEANDAVLVGCSVEGEEIAVAVTVAGPRWLGQAGDLEAHARAGPVDSDG